ncbi:Uncharacterised protein [uncultured Clostridium sp.]|nr:Uncharacterised protein [uncultured Clostridium sp.]
MNLEQKKHYLESYKRAREKYETLKCSLESVHSASYFECKDRNNKPSKNIIDKINEVDNAYFKQLDEFIKINKLLLNDNILYCKYVCLMSDEEIANDNDMSTKEMKKWIDRRISKLSIV